MAYSADTYSKQTDIYTHLKHEGIVRIIKQGYGMCVCVFMCVCLLLYKGTHVKLLIFLSQTCGSYETSTV